MIAAIRITRGPFRVVRRLARKVVKPIALFLATRELRLSEERADYLLSLRTSIAPVEKRERERTVHLVGRRNQIRSW